MSRHERYGTRDLTYSRWHRYALHDDITMIDLDAVEYCHRCRMPLLLIETARDIGQAGKPTTVLKALAASANVAAICVLYTPAPTPCTCGEQGRVPGCEHGVSSLRVRSVAPTERRTWTTISPSDFAAWLCTVHDGHNRAAHTTWGS